MFGPHTRGPTSIAAQRHSQGVLVSCAQVPRVSGCVVSNAHSELRTFAVAHADNPRIFQVWPGWTHTFCGGGRGAVGRLDTAVWVGGTSSLSVGVLNTCIFSSVEG